MWEIETALPLRLALMQVEEVIVSEDKTAFPYLEDAAREYHAKYSGYAPADIEGVQCARRLFRNIGVDPTKHRPSSEALLHRALKKKEFYSVNTLVDVANWCSLDFLLPISVYDLDKIVGAVTIRKGTQKESYRGLNNRVVNLYNRYVLADDIGPFGSPMTDSLRTAVNCVSKRVVLVIFAPADYEPECLRRQGELFAQRVRDICGGVCKSVTLLGAHDT